MKVNIYSLRNIADKILRRTARSLIPLHVTPNALSVVSLLFAVISALYFYLAGTQTSFISLLLALVFLILSSFLDALDGPLAREMGIPSKRGNYLDHTIDRFADVFVIGGIALGGYISLEIGLVVIAVIPIISYLGVQAQALGDEREYRGIMGRAYRLVLLIAFTLLNLIYNKEIGFRCLDFSFSFTFIGWAMIIFAVGGIATIIQRFYYTWQALKSG